MWTSTYTQIVPDLKSTDIWPLWIDIDNWPTWHGDLDDCKLNGSFQVGSHFMLTPKGQKPVKIKITEIDEGKSFTDCTAFPGAKMYDTHSMEDTPAGLKLTNTLIVKGPLQWVWVRLVAQHVADSVPEETESLIQRARTLNGDSTIRV